MKLMATWLQFIICLNGEKMRLMKIITFLITHSVVFFKRKTQKDTIYKFILVQDEKISNFELSTPSSKIYDDAYRFECQDLEALLSANNLNNIEHENFVVNTRFNLVSEKDSDLLDLLIELTKNLDKKENITVL